MVNVNIKFNGRDYLLACEDGQEEDLEKLRQTQEVFTVFFPQEEARLASCSVAGATEQLA